MHCNKSQDHKYNTNQYYFNHILDILYYRLSFNYVNNFIIYIKYKYTIIKKSDKLNNELLQTTEILPSIEVKLEKK